MTPFTFEVIKQDPGSKARLGQMQTRHGAVNTPVFAPVGTQGTVKSLTPEDLREIGIELLLGNTYHLLLRPGPEVIKRFGGLHRFIHWSGPILTDSGGFQVYSLSPLRKITEEGVAFRSHLDGSEQFLSPERSIEVQEVLDSDIIIALDECIPYPASFGYASHSTELTTRWAERCLKARANRGRALFAVVQGGTFTELRLKSARDLVALNFDGYAIGGLSVGETKAAMFEMVDATVPLLPEDKPRYLMGVGKPEDLLEAVLRGVDIFDCVMPTRNARNGMLFTSFGSILLKRREFEADERPVDEGCGCYTCSHYSRAYLRHLFLAQEILSARLNTIHNLFFYTRTMGRIREAIAAGRLAALAAELVGGRKELTPLKEVI